MYAENPLKRGLCVCSVEAMASQRERRARMSAEFAGPLTLRSLWSLRQTMSDG
jgi:hypothetical protein